MDVISIIIPVYNVEKYLDECIQSVLDQEYKNLEIILIDDGSTDSSSKKCDAWREKDDRIIVIHKQNEGLGEARNTGLEYVSGKYVYFLDSDDFLTPTCIKRLYDTAETEQADIVGSGTYVYLDGETSVFSIPREYKVYRERDVINKFLPNIIAPDPETGEFVGFAMCISGMFFLAKLLNGWRCASERFIISEDVYSFIDLCSRVKCVVELPEFTNYYRMNDNSLSHTIRDDRNEQNKKFLCECRKLVERKGYPEIVKKRLIFPYLSFVLADLKSIAKSDKKNKRKLIYSIISDEELVSSLSDYDLRSENLKRKAVIISIKNRWFRIAYLLIRIQALRG